MSEVGGKKNRISNGTLTVMAIIAFLFDLLEIALLLIWGVGLVLNRLVVFVKWWIFWFWFGSKDVPFLKLDSKKSVQRFAVIGITSVIGIIPGLGALPEFTIGIIALGLLVKAEDKVGISTGQIDALVKEGRTLKKDLRDRSQRNSSERREGGRTIRRNLNEAPAT
jgi:hypothetical protein